MNTRSSSIREIIEDRCLRSKSHFTLKDIMEAVNWELGNRGEKLVKSKRTILDDIYGIANRWHINLNIYKIGRYTYYSYEDPDFTIYKTPLKEEEIINLATTLIMLNRFQGLPNFEWIHDFTERCKKILGPKVVDEEIVGLEENPYVKGLDFLTPLYDAIVHKDVIDLQYRPFGAEEPQMHIVHPYYLKQYNTRWFLLGSNDRYTAISNFALDRIEKVSVSGRVKFQENVACDFRDYFEDMIGVSKPKDSPLEKVKIWICKDQWPYIETKPMHGSQKVLERNEDGSAVVQIEVVLNWELEQLLLLHGERMKVIEPESLREKMANRIQNMFELYK